MIRILAAITLSLSVIFGSWIYYSRVEDQALRSSAKVRQAMVQRQHAEQRLRRLGDGQTNPLLRILGEDVSSVQIRIAEHFAGLDSGSESADQQLMYEQSLLAVPLPAEGLVNSTDTQIEAIRILRLDVQGQLADAQEFMSFLRNIYSEVGGWPIVVRACDIQKLPVQVLNVRCVMDIHYWTVGLDEADS